MKFDGTTTSDHLENRNGQIRGRMEGEIVLLRRRSKMSMRVDKRIVS